MLSVLKCFKRLPIKINQNKIELFTNFRFHDIIKTYNLKNNVLFNKLKEWYTHFSSSNQGKHLKDVLTKQQHLQKVQDERREIGKLIADVRKLFIEKQDKILLINRWDRIQEYVNLRKEEAELIRKEYELAAKFEELEKNEKELFFVLNNTVRGSYEKEKAKTVYTKYWVIIIIITIIMLREDITKMSTNVEGKPFNVEEKPFNIDNYKIQNNQTVILGLIGSIGLLMLICGSCR